jgi:hypothetical protein
MASRQASSSKSTSSRAGGRAVPRGGDVALKARVLGEAGQVEHHDLEAERLSHLVQSALRQLAEASLADERPRHASQRAESCKDLRVRPVGQRRVLADGPLLSRHDRAPRYFGRAQRA